MDNNLEKLTQIAGRMCDSDHNTARVARRAACYQLNQDPGYPISELKPMKGKIHLDNMMNPLSDARNSYSKRRFYSPISKRFESNNLHHGR